MHYSGIACTLLGGNPAQLTFQYHMYGSNMGTLKIMDDSNTVLWQRSGCNPCSWSGSWRSQTVALSGGPFRFEYLRGSSYRGDASIAAMSLQCGMNPPAPPVSPPSVPPPAYPPGCEPDTCPYKIDGHCDDGGWGAEYSDCDLGTDCYDCGPRMSPPPSFPPVAPLNGDPNAFPLIVPLLETRLTVAMPIQDWEDRFNDAGFRANLNAGLRSVFDCFNTPRCEVEIKSATAMEMDWNTACNRALPPPPDQPPLPPSPPPPPLMPPPSPPKAGNATVGDNITVPVVAAASGPTCNRNGTLVTVITTWQHAEVVEFCPPSAPMPPPDPPSPPLPSPPPSPWYDRVNDGVNPMSFQDAFFRAQLRIQGMYPPSPPPPPPPGCISSEQLIAATVNVTERAKTAVNAMTVESVEATIQVPSGTLASLVMGSDKDRTTKGIHMPPSTPPPPPVPSVPPPPPSPPAPPAPPPAFCSNTCNDMGLGTPNVCDDGADLTSQLLMAQAPCSVGSDCDDCPLRPICFSCPDECAAEAIQHNSAERSCLEHHWNLDGCFPQCNNAACGHRHCTTEASIVECLAEEVRLGGDFITAPSDPTDVSILPFNLGQFKLVVNGGLSNVVMADFNVEYTLSWVDHRLKSSACRAVFNLMLSSLGSTESPHVSRYWRPTLDIATEESNPETRDLISSEFSYNMTTSTASLVRQERFIIPQAFYYGFFPFDHQDILLDISVPGTNLTGCTEFVTELRNNEIATGDDIDPMKMLLPATAAWLYDTCSSAHGNCEPAKINNDLFAGPTSNQERCALRIKVRRDNFLELIKNIGPLVVVGYVPVLTLWLDPSLPPLVSGRVSAHIFSVRRARLERNATNAFVCILHAD